MSFIPNFNNSYHMHLKSMCHDRDKSSISHLFYKPNITLDIIIF